MPTLLLTGATGFLGKMFYRKLSEHFEVSTLGRSRGNILPINLEREVPQFTQAFKWVVHNAGKAHTVPRNAAEADLFYAVNFQGTLNLLKGLEQAPALPQLFIFISTVAVYGLDYGENITETTPLLGNSPYSKSKILAETAIRQWCEDRGIQCVILRLPLVVGPNPPGNLGAMLRAIRKGYYLAIRNNQAAKSMVGAQDVVDLVARLCLGNDQIQTNPRGIFNLTDGVHPAFCTVETVLEQVSEHRIRLRIPLWSARVLAKTGDFLQQLGFPVPLNSDKLSKITTSLTFDDQKARRELGWKPSGALEGFEIMGQEPRK